MALRVLVLVALAVCAHAQTIGNCPVFPVNNVWNARVDSLPVHSQSAAYIGTIGAMSHGHADFGAGLYQGAPIGIPFTTVPGTQAKVPIAFDPHDANESDPGPYPIPPNAPVEGGTDRHVLVIDRENCVLYEMFSSFLQADGSWMAGSGAVFDLKANKLRTAFFTSADAAGLPIFPGLARYDEMASGEIRHALRFTAPQTQKAFVWPGRHYASSITDTSYPPMGQRFRLKASVDISGYSLDTQVILRAIQRYGMILADNGSAWFVSGAPDDRWNNDHLSEFRRLQGTDFEAVDESSLMVDPNSAAVKAASPPAPAKIGVFRQGFLWVLDANGNHAMDDGPSPGPNVFGFGGLAGDIPIWGDWNGDGHTKPGFVRNGNQFWLDKNGNHLTDDGFTTFGGLPGDIPVAGDWNGDGKTKIGMYRHGLWVLDLNGDGIENDGPAFPFGGIASDIPVVGDWNGDGKSKAGVFRDGFLWVLDYDGTHNNPVVFAFGGIAGDRPVVGDWAGTGVSQVGIFRQGFLWVLDANGNHTMDDGSAYIFAFGGINGDIPVVGKW